MAELQIRLARAHLRRLRRASTRLLRLQQSRGRQERTLQCLASRSPLPRLLLRSPPVQAYLRPARRLLSRTVRPPLAQERSTGRARRLLLVRRLRLVLIRSLPSMAETRISVPAPHP